MSRADLIVLETVARRGVHEARAALARYVLAKQDRQASFAIQWVYVARAFELLSCEYSSRSSTVSS